ncbi:NAD(P)H-dependent oxidoreductase [Candidatus Bathyarchaeota archaeon]|nr:MAG: NAD(P)H-dependent oxidoreductase [Candidatus Bathyarchaeota archaeon]
MARLSVSDSEKKKTAVRILGISGSARKRSYNTALLNAAEALVPESAVLETFDVSRFPLFNDDLVVEMPPEIRDFKQRVKDADAILFATPEYNYSISAVLKNAIEWGNQPDNSWDGKPAAIISASISLRGGARAQAHLRQIMVDLNMFPVNQPQLLLAQAREKFDANLRLVDPVSVKTLQSLLVALVEWTRRLKQ